jgi:hypothetical protein
MFECGITKSNPQDRSDHGARVSHLAAQVLLAAVGAWLCLGVGVFAQGANGARNELPSSCIGKFGPGASNGALSAIAQALHHRALKIAQAPSADVAFACSIIAHDLAAIDLARREVRDGKDPLMKAVARSVLDNARKEVGTLADRLNGPSI